MTPVIHLGEMLQIRLTSRARMYKSFTRYTLELRYIRAIVTVMTNDQSGEW